MVSPIIPFMQLRDLMPYALNPQIGIKGSVVNIPVEIPEMVQTLPRLPNQMQTIQLKLKRRLDHQTSYKFESISPYATCKALKYLCA